MKYIIFKSLIIFLLIISVSDILKAQIGANQTLQAVYSKLTRANDYSVTANIKVDLPFIRILPIDAEIYYKQKDKFRVKSRGIAIVPRQGFNQVTEILADTSSFSTVQLGTELIANVQTCIINIIPKSDTSDLILGKFWIDPKQNVILKSQLTTRSNGTILMEYYYGKLVVYGLPDKIIFTVDVKKFRAPVNYSANIASNSNENNDNADKTKDLRKGQIMISFRNYKINKGIPDIVFEKN